MRIPDENGLDKVEAMKSNYRKYKLDCLVVLGGNGTHKTANLLREEGLNVVTLPKTAAYPSAAHNIGGNPSSCLLYTSLHLASGWSLDHSGA